MVLTALERSNAVVVYVHQTYAEARNIMWADPVDGLSEVIRGLGIPDVRVNESRLEIVLPNGSVIRLMGADRGAWAKLRGQKLDLLVLDEMQKAEDDGLDRALSQVVPDCLAARRGRFRGIGTPDEFCVGRFHDLCVSMPPPWSVHHWTAEDLSDRTPVWEEQLRWKTEHNIADDDPVWLREKRGQWVRQDDRLMMPLTDLGLWDGTYPTLVRALDGTMVKRSTDFEHYAGLDFGFTDSAALVIGSISREEGILREVLSWKSTALDTDALAAAIKPMLDRFKVRRIYGDSARPDTIVTLARKFKLPIVGAEKHDKVAWIQDMRGKARIGRFQVLRDSALHEELKTLVPDPAKLKKKKLESPPGAEDHCWDAGRYLYRGVMSSDVVRVPLQPMTDMQRRQADVERWKDQKIKQNRDSRTLRR